MENKILEVLVKKSNMIAKSSFDYEKIKFNRENFISCCFEDQDENIKISYNIGHILSMVDINKEGILTKLSVLIGVSNLLLLKKEYNFSLNPNNLYYTRSGQVRVLYRDVYERGQLFQEEEFILEYKSLIGCIMQKKYSFEDYLGGGLDLLKKDKFLSEIYEAKDVDRIQSLLEDKFNSLDEDFRKNKVEVNKKKYKTSRIVLVCTIFIMLASLSYNYYLHFYQIKTEQAVISAYGSYLSEDYVKVIDKLKDIDVKNLEEKQKYILAISYVKGENLTPEQKKNILAKLVPGGDTSIMDYWIALGRMDIEEAKNIAMQISDDELLLYAYMSEKNITETDSTLSGKEKSDKVSEIQSKIDSLSEKYVEEETK